VRYELFPLIECSDTGVGPFHRDTNRIRIGGVGGNDEDAGVTAG